MSDNVTTLPTSVDQRWQPTRVGLISLWRYWDETFTFHNGRLLLRGPNGSGKSMALELLLPFLLDADASPSRLTSSAKSRGGLYERLMTGSVDSSRAGFAWIEFRWGGRTFTAGARMRASKDTRKVDLAFFTTDQVVGDDLHLLDDHRVPLSRKGLIEAIGDRGRVHASGDEHRAAVRSVLYPGFSADRYASVITALLALRKEKLSQNLDLDKLSLVLSEALPAIDDHDIAVVAEGFERLDRRRSELTALDAELEEVRSLARHQRTYARAVVASVTSEVRAAETKRDDVTRAEREAREALGEAQREASQAEGELAALDARLAAVEVEMTALKDSGAYRDGAALNDLRNDATRWRETVQRDQLNSEARTAERAERVTDVNETARAVAAAQSQHDLAVDDLRRAAVGADAESLVTVAVSGDDGDDGEWLLSAWAGARRQLIAEMRAAIDLHRDAVAARGFAEGRVDDDQQAVERLALGQRAAAAAHGQSIDTYRRAVDQWAASCLAAGVLRVQSALPSPPDDPSAVTDAIADVRATVQAEHAVARQAIDTSRTEADVERQALLDERTPLAEGHLVEPEQPAWRTDRLGRAGAPLWRLVDVAPHIEAAVVDGFEAALEGAGLLDAWISPSGRVEIADGDADLVLTERPTTGRSLAEILIPLSEGAVPGEVVQRALASIAVADSVNDTDAGATADTDVVIGADGSFRLGSGVGQGRRAPAVRLGAAAQERRRLARLAELDVAIAAIDARLADLDRAMSAADARAAAAHSDLDAAPNGEQVRAATRDLVAAEVRAAEAETRLIEAQQALRAAEDSVRAALRALTAMGAQHQLPTAAEDLSVVSDAVDQLERRGGVWARRSRELAGARRDNGRAERGLEQATEAADRAAADLLASVRQAAEVEGRLAALESTLGAEYQEVLGRLSSLESERAERRERRRVVLEAQPALERRVGKLENQLGEAELARQRADDDRATAHRRFVGAAADGLAADAGIDVRSGLEGPSSILAEARSVWSGLENVSADSAAIEKASARVLEAVHHARTALRGRFELDRELTHEQWWVLRASVSGVRRSAADLGDALQRQLDEGRAELAADEERLFEQTLAGSVRRALATRIRQANQLVGTINTQLASVRTAAGGVEVRLRWDVDADQPAAVKAARSLLLRDPADLSDDERASLQAFVRARVDQARAELEAHAPWEARLRETLDYRVWHRFTLQVGHRDWDGLQPATARRLQQLSTGERSIVLHLPMLASIAAHYADDAGNPSSCPRLILLDELFAGVDTANRAQLFGTFTAWNLDAVFTSDHEWCQYATLDGIAIHHLHPPTGDEPVTSTRFTWDGSRRSIDPSAA